MFTSVNTEWVYTPEAIIVFCKSESQARSEIKEHKKWAELATMFRVPRAWIKYPGCKRMGFEVLASMAETEGENKNKELQMFDAERIFPVLETANGLPMSPGILRALETIAANPNERWVLLRLEQDLSAQVQIAMTESMQSCIVGANIKQALNRDRMEYFHPQDLEDIKRQTRQSQEFTAKWRGFSPVTKADWREFSYTYRTVDRANGFIWQLGHCLDLPRSIATPV